MSGEWQQNEGICVTPDDHVREAKRLANADPFVDRTQEGWQEVWNQTYTHNLLNSIAHSLAAIAERIEFGDE